MSSDRKFEIVKENGTVKARVRNDGFGEELSTMRNGYQWTGQPISPELARLTIEVLTEYLELDGSKSDE